MSRPAPTQSAFPPRRSRHCAFRMLALAVVVVAGGCTLCEDEPWVSDARAADRASTPPTQGAAGPTAATLAPLRALVWSASLAARGHNTQPWKVALRQGATEIHPDLTRHLPAVDPQSRELWISLGCALEKLLVAARTAGSASEVTSPDTEDVIRVHLTPDAPQVTSQSAAILTRQHSRSVYDGRPLQSAHLDRLRAAPLEPGVSLQFNGQAELETVLEFVNQGNLKQSADQAYLKELVRWLRFDKRGALASLDGLYPHSSGNPVVPRWLGERFMTGMKPRRRPTPIPESFAALPAPS